MESKKRLLQGALLCCAAAMIRFGLSRGEGMTVLYKAINICMECIGLG